MVSWGTPKSLGMVEFLSSQTVRCYVNFFQSNSFLEISVCIEVLLKSLQDKPDPKSLEYYVEAPSTLHLKV